MPTPQQSSHLIWDSEGTSNLAQAVALSAAQKTATGKSGPIGNPAGSFSGLDLTQFETLELIVILASFTGGSSPTFQPQLSMLDDEGTVSLVPLFKPSAASSATKWFTEITKNSFGGSAPTISGFTVTQVAGMPIPERVQFDWTVANTPTAVAWVAYLYGY